MVSLPWPAPRLRYALVNLCILGLALWLRLAALERLPIFVDEGTHLNWAQRFSLGQTDYPWLMHGKFLLGVAVAQFQVAGPAPLWLGRAAVAVLSVAGCAACIAAGRLLGPRLAGPLAGALYASLPYTVFHERQILADPLMACAGSVALAACLKLARSQPKRWVFVVAVALAATILFKLTGTVYLAALGLACVILPADWRRRRRLALRVAAAAALAASVFIVTVEGLGARAGSGSAELIGEQIGFVGCPPLVCQGDLAQQIDWSLNAASELPQAVTAYLGWPVVLLAALAWPLAGQRQRRPVAFLWWFTVIVLAAFLLSAKDSLPPRYYSPLAMPLLALAAAALISLAQRLAARSAAPRWLSTAALLAGVGVLSLAPLANTLPLIFTPDQAALPPVDEWQYRSGPYAGTGFPEAAGAIRAREAGVPQPGLILIDHFLTTSFQAYFDPTGLYPVSPASVDWPTLTSTLRAGGNVYLVDEIAADGSANTFLRLGGARALRVRAFDGLEPAALRPLYEVVFGQTASFRDDYAGLAAFWSSQPAGRLATYPPNQLALLSSLLAEPAQAGALDIGGEAPWDPAATLAQLAQAAGEDQPLAVVFRDETRLDSQRWVETWLNTHLFRLEERWFGPLRLVAYAPSARTGKTLPAGAHFGDSITLAALELVDPKVSRGQVARFRLLWQAAAPVDRPYKVFLHVFAGDTIAAQHDGQPAGELRPTSTWQPGELIIDQFAVRLSAEALPGAYQLRVGLVDLETQVRLPAVLADGTAAEFFTGGTLTVE